MEEKNQYLKNKGIFLLSKPNGKGKINLYAVNNFFVEIRVDEKDLITAIVTFNTPGCLEQYTRHLSLSEINTSNFIRRANEM